MSQSKSTPAAADAALPAATPASPTVPPVQPPPFRPKGAAVGSLVSKLGPLLLIALVVAVGALFYMKSQEDAQRQADDQLKQEIALIPTKHQEAPKRIEAYETLLKKTEYASHPYMTDLRMQLITEYFDVVTSFDATAVTSDQTRNEYRARLKALAQEVIDRTIVDQRTLLAYYKRGQVFEDEGEYTKALADYEAARDTATAPKVLIKPMESFLSFHIAQCYYWLYRQADAGQKEEYRLKAADALTAAQNSKDVKQMLNQQIEFLRRELKAAEPILNQLPDLAPRTPVAMEPTAAAAPAVPADGAAFAPAPAPAPADGAAAPTEGVVPAPAPNPAVPTEGHAPAAPAPVPAPAPAPAPTEEKPAGGGWMPQ